MPTDEEFWNTIDRIADAKQESFAFRVPEVRKLLGLPKGKGKNELVRDFCREHYVELRKKGIFFLVDYNPGEYDRRRRNHQWFLVKQTRPSR